MLYMILYSMLFEYNVKEKELFMLAIFFFLYMPLYSFIEVWII